MKNISLTALFFFTVGAYHLNNLFHLDEFTLDKQWKESAIHLEWNGVEAKLPTPRIRHSEGVFQEVAFGPVYKTLDASSRKIADAGYILRYLLGQISDRFVMGPSHPIARFYGRTELEYQFPLAKEQILRDSAKIIPKGVKYFEKGGVTPIFLSPPTRITFQRHHLPEKLPLMKPFDPHSRYPKEDPYAVYKVLIDTAPKNVVDLFTIFQNYQRMFPQKDLTGTIESHWTPLGMSLGVVGVIEKLKERGWNLGRPKLVFEGTRPPDWNYNYIKYLHLPEYFVKRMANFQWQEELYRVELSLPQKPNFKKGRIIVAGTSYSHRDKHTAYGIGPQLARIFGWEKHDFSMPGRGIMGTLAHMKEIGFQLQPNDLLIWESPIHSRTLNPQPNFPVIAKSKSVS